MSNRATDSLVCKNFCRSTSMVSRDPVEQRTAGTRRRSRGWAAPFPFSTGPPVRGPCGSL